MGLMETGRKSMKRCAELLHGHSIEGKPRKPRTSAANRLIGSSFSILAEGASSSGPNLPGRTLTRMFTDVSFGFHASMWGTSL
jgi:hypothetical protein